MPPRLVPRLAAAAWALALVPLAATAAEPLAWKFAPGLTNRYRMSHDTSFTIDSGAAEDAAAESSLVTDVSWTVEKLNDDGSALLVQRIDRLRRSAGTGDGSAAEIDSAAEKDPNNQAAMLVPLFKALTANPFQVTMTPRGEITSVELPEPLAEALKNQPGAPQMGDLATAEGFKKLVQQASFVLPEKLEPGVEWTATSETQLPAVGKQTAATTYRYEGPKEVDGRPLEAFAARVSISFSGGEAPVTVTNQESVGEILFNREAGRLESSRLDMAIDLKITVAGQEVAQHVEQTVVLEWVPEKEADVAP